MYRKSIDKRALGLKESWQVWHRRQQWSHRRISLQTNRSCHQLQTRPSHYPSFPILRRWLCKHEHFRRSFHLHRSKKPQLPQLRHSMIRQQKSPKDRFHFHHQCCRRLEPIVGVLDWALVQGSVLASGLALEPVSAMGSELASDWALEPVSAMGSELVLDWELEQ